MNLAQRSTIFWPTWRHQAAFGHYGPVHPLGDAHRGVGKALRPSSPLWAWGVVIVTMILPLILRGFNPIVVTVGLCSLLTGLFILFVTGPTKKTAAAIAGTVGGCWLRAF